MVNLKCEEREPAEGEDGNDDDEHAHNAFPFVESLGPSSVESGRREFTGCRVEPQRVGDTSVRDQHRQHLCIPRMLSLTYQIFISHSTNKLKQHSRNKKTWV